MKRACRIAVVLCGVGFPLAATAEVTLPHTFTPNTPARASEVNENFTAVKDAIDDAVERVDAAETQLATLAQTPLGGLKVRVNDVVVGTLFSADNIHVSFRSLIALNERGFFINLKHSNADETPGASSALQTVYSFYFDQPGCQGNMAVANVASFPETSLVFRQGVVFAAAPGDSVTARYVKGDAAPFNVASQLTWDIMSSDFACMDSMTPWVQDALPALPNDPDVTGVPSDISGPVRVAIN